MLLIVMLEYTYKKMIINEKNYKHTQNTKEDQKEGFPHSQYSFSSYCN